MDTASLIDEADEHDEMLFPLIRSKYRMAWVMVFFDLPVDTKAARKRAGDFRKSLLREGFIKVQFSVYARPCASPEKVRSELRRVKSAIPVAGEVRAMTITDAQWARMIVYCGARKEKPEKMPEQLLLF